MKKLFWICSISFLTLHSPAQSNAPVQLALISETDEASAASDILIAQFSGNQKIHLLERDEIEKVYREQGLSVGNKDYLKLGQILGADGLLLVKKIKEGTIFFERPTDRSKTRRHFDRRKICLAIGFGRMVGGL